IDESSSRSMAEAIVLNAKLQRPSVCNAVETILIHKNWFNEYGKSLIDELMKNDVFIHGDDQVVSLTPGVSLATDEDWSAEYLDLEVAVKSVSNLSEAINHINKYGTQHSEAILTEN